MTFDLVSVIDDVLETSDETSPRSLVPSVLDRLNDDQKELALRETLRAYIELRIHETQDEPSIVETDSSKVRENRVRRIAERRGYRLVKSRRRDDKAIDYGRYALVSSDEEGPIDGAFGSTLAEIEAILDARK